MKQESNKNMKLRELCLIIVHTNIHEDHVHTYFLNKFMKLF